MDKKIINIFLSKVNIERIKIFALFLNKVYNQNNINFKSIYKKVKYLYYKIYFKQGGNLWEIN